MSHTPLILLVDDDCEFNKAMKKMLEREGYRVTVARNGLEALQVLSRGAADLVVSEVRMPELDGTGLMTEIRSKAIDVPVIFLTAYGEVESYLEVMNKGAFEYLNKPIRSPEILNVIGKALKRRRDMPTILGTVK